MNQKLSPTRDSIDAVVNELKSENKKLRYLLFMAHGNEEHYLYGDDGERTCNTCWIDFNADSADEIERKLLDYNMRKLKQLLTTTSSPDRSPEDSHTV